MQSAYSNYSRSISLKGYEEIMQKAMITSFSFSGIYSDSPGAKNVTQCRFDLVT